MDVIEIDRFSDIDLSTVTKVEIQEVGTRLVITCTAGAQVLQTQLPSEKFPALSAKLVLSQFAVREDRGIILAIRSGAVKR